MSTDEESLKGGLAMTDPYRTKAPDPPEPRKVYCKDCKWLWQSEFKHSELDSCRADTIEDPVSGLTRRAGDPRKKNALFDCWQFESKHTPEVPAPPGVRLLKWEWWPLVVVTVLATGFEALVLWAVW